MGSLTNDAIVKFICNIPKNINIAIYVIRMEKLSRSLYGNIISVNRSHMNREPSLYHKQLQI